MLHLNVFGVLDSVLVNDLSRMGITGFRVDLLPGDAEAQRNVEKIKVAARHPEYRWNFLLWGGDWSYQGRAATMEQFHDLLRTNLESMKSLLDPYLLPQYSVEPGNEPDNAVFPWCQPEWTSRAVMSSIDLIQAVFPRYTGLKIIMPGPKNMHQESLQWFKEFWAAPMSIDRAFDSQVAQGIHRYPPVDHPATPHEGFESLYAEWKAFKEVSPIKTWCMTETGLSLGPHTKPRFPKPFQWLFPRTTYLTQTEQGERLTAWLMYLAAIVEIEEITLYQINSGPDRKNILHNYGLRDPAGDWTGFAHVLGIVTQHMNKLRRKRFDALRNNG